MRFELFYTADAAEFKPIVAEKLGDVFAISTVDGGVLELHKGAYNAWQGQYDALALLDHLIKNMTTGHAIWVVGEDIYYDHLNFVMGLAMYHVAGIVSTYRLDSAGMVAKECVHEVGHVLGLDHCKDDCVMRFSSSIDDAQRKPAALCPRCRAVFNRKVIEPRPLM